MGKKRKSQAKGEGDNVVETKSKVKKLKHIDDENIESKKDIDATTSIAETVKKNSGSRNSSKPKKIIFVDDQPQEVPVEGNNKKNKKQKSTQRIQNESEESNTDILREEDVKDEDIDKFCDELNEEDNKQYEDWVRLIEANLSSNKKKPK